MGVRRSYVKIKLTMKSCIWWFSKFEATRIWKITLYMVRTNYIDVINLRKIYADSPNTVVRFLCLLRELYMWRERELFAKPHTQHSSQKQISPNDVCSTEQVLHTIFRVLLFLQATGWCFHRTRINDNTFTQNI